MVGVMLAGSLSIAPVQAAKKISYNKAVSMYNAKMSYWDRKNTKLKITCDLRDRCSSGYNDKGKKVSVRTFTRTGFTRYIFKDLNGDKVPEALFYNENARAIIVMTIYKNKVKLVGTLRSSDFLLDWVRYNKKNKTFILNTCVYWNNRTVTRNVFKIRKGKLSRVCTLANYVAPINHTGKDDNIRWLNGKRVSAKKYNKYLKKYYRYNATYHWGP